jgi:hypothetical protein
MGRLHELARLAVEAAERVPRRVPRTDQIGDAPHRLVLLSLVLAEEKVDARRPLFPELRVQVAGHREAFFIHYGFLPFSTGVRSSV